MSDKDNPNPTTPPPPPADNGVNKSGQPSQDDASRAVKERIKRVKESTRAEILKELGFDDLEKAKTAYTEVRQIKEGQLTEAQKAQKDLEKLRTEKADFETKYKAERAQRIQDRVDSALKAATGLADPDEQENALILIRKRHEEEVADLVDDDGKVDAAAVKKLVDTFRTANPKLFGAGGPGSPSNRAAGVKAPDPAKQTEKPGERKSLFRL